jgi:hypothetical protein
MPQPIFGPFSPLDGDVVKEELYQLLVHILFKTMAFFT